MCKSCGRFFDDRASWRSRGISHEVRYCSDLCRRFKPRAAARALEERALEQLAHSGGALTLSALSERLAQPKTHEAQRALRWAVRRLAHQGALRFEQGGQAVEPGRDKGELTLRLCQNKPS